MPLFVLWLYYVYYYLFCGYTNKLFSLQHLPISKTGSESAGFGVGDRMTVATSSAFTAKCNSNDVTPSEPFVSETWWKVSLSNRNIGLKLKPEATCSLQSLKSENDCAIIASSVCRFIFNYLHLVVSPGILQDPLNFPG